MSIEQKFGLLGATVLIVDGMALYLIWEHLFGLGVFTIGMLAVLAILNSTKGY